MFFYREEVFWFLCCLSSSQRSRHVRFSLTSTPLSHASLSPRRKIMAEWDGLGPWWSDVLSYGSNSNWSFNFTCNSSFLDSCVSSSLDERGEDTFRVVISLQSETAAHGDTPGLHSTKITSLKTDRGDSVGLSSSWLVVVTEEERKRHTCSEKRNCQWPLSMYYVSENHLDWASFVWFLGKKNELVLAR